eukprot:CAMPEP_0168318776 /NCGR_PEP_ID=MMETSP0213-20121227/672_1 /TAXON_ID=151035 /ORGANISM="Euplotes harpa, Strain FSP1.4" /LENGTH=327 /DNA_ID=CAMNT_0008319891 /DNA_START=249 /DNA_END=1232 /DNA_ORIENTATION=+
MTKVYSKSLLDIEEKLTELMARLQNAIRSESAQDVIVTGNEIYAYKTELETTDNAYHFAALHFFEKQADEVEEEEKISSRTSVKDNKEYQKLASEYSQVYEKFSGLKVKLKDKRNIIRNLKDEIDSKANELQQQASKIQNLEADLEKKTSELKKVSQESLANEENKEAKSEELETSFGTLSKLSFEIYNKRQHKIITEMFAKKIDKDTAMKYEKDRMIILDMNDQKHLEIIDFLKSTSPPVLKKLGIVRHKDEEHYSHDVLCEFFSNSFPIFVEKFQMENNDDGIMCINQYFDSFMKMNCRITEGASISFFELDTKQLFLLLSCFRL